METKAGFNARKNFWKKKQKKGTKKRKRNMFTARKQKNLTV
jgi:hypothetical protein